MQNMCFKVQINGQYANDRHANEQLVNSENWSLYWRYQNNTGNFTDICINPKTQCNAKCKINVKF